MKLAMEANAEEAVKWASYFMDRTPHTRLGEPEDVARTALFLASDDSSYITGQVISVNGGMYM